MAKSKKKEEKKPKVHKDLEGFEISINEFGQINSSLPLDKINSFLNETVSDKKFTDEIYDQFEEE